MRRTPRTYAAAAAYRPGGGCLAAAGTGTSDAYPASCHRFVKGESHATSACPARARDLSAAVTVIRDHELAFYDRFLKEESNDWDARPPLDLFVLGANEWRGEHEWPLARTEFSPWYLRSGGVLDRDVPRSDEPADRYS